MALHADTHGGVHGRPQTTNVTKGGTVSGASTKPTVLAVTRRTQRPTGPRGK